MHHLAFVNILKQSILKTMQQSGSKRFCDFLVFDYPAFHSRTSLVILSYAKECTIKMYYQLNQTQKIYIIRI